MAAHHTTCTKFVNKQVIFKNFYTLNWQSKYKLLFYCDVLIKNAILVVV